jgi:Recombinase
VRHIFYDIAEGARSIRATQTALNDEAIPASKGGLWSRARIRQIILDDCYLPHTVDELSTLNVDERVIDALDPGKRYGVWYYNKNTVKKWRDPVTFQTHTQFTKKPRSEWLAVPIPDLGIPRERVEMARKNIEGNIAPTRADGKV